MHINKLNNGMNTEHIISISNAFVKCVFSLSLSLLAFGALSFTFPSFSFSFQFFEFIFFCFSSIKFYLFTNSSPNRNSKDNFVWRRLYPVRQTFQIHFYAINVNVHAFFKWHDIFKWIKSMPKRWLIGIECYGVQIYSSQNIFHFCISFKRNKANIKMPNWSELPTSRHSV